VKTNVFFQITHRVPSRVVNVSWVPTSCAPRVDFRSRKQVNCQRFDSLAGGLVVAALWQRIARTFHLPRLLITLPSLHIIDYTQFEHHCRSSTQSQLSPIATQPSEIRNELSLVASVLVHRSAPPKQSRTHEAETCRHPSAE
jgi:hypothetical protein